MRFRALLPLFVLPALLAGCPDDEDDVRVVADTTTIEFGEVMVGSEAGELLTLTNIGTDAGLLDPAEAHVNGAGFSFAGLDVPTGIGPGGSVQIVVRFRPPVVGWVAGELEITGTGWPEDVVVILYGRGVDDLPADADGDGHGDVLEGGDDCDDSDPEVHPDAEEQCGNAVDDDCDGTADLLGDVDGDASDACDDCDDANSDVFPGATEQCGNAVDDDCEGTVDLLGDGDGDASDACDDCDDGEATVYPGAPEACDGVDSDCDSSLLDDFPDLDLDLDPDCTDPDADGDGEDGNPGSDCDDLDSAVFTGAEEQAGDGIDQDCDGTDALECFADADLDGIGTAAVVLAADGACDDPGESEIDSDCDDGDAGIFPGAAETCDAVDSDCDSSLVDEFPDLDLDADPDCIDPDADGDGEDGNPGSDCDDLDPSVFTGAGEQAGDGIDQDCDGSDTVWCFVDADHDGTGTAAVVLAPDGDCADPGESASDDDCDDGDDAVFPGAAESCDAVDSDCDGSLLDGFSDLDEDTEPDCTDPDADGDGEDGNPGSDCDDLDETVYTGAPEQADDGIDQDCDGIDPVSCFFDADQDGAGTPVVILALDGDCDDTAESASDDDCDDGDASVLPGAPETCDAVDSDCDGSVVDEFADLDGDLDPDCTDPDRDGDGEAGPPGGDCDDLDQTIFSGAPEQPDDGIDQDCNGHDTVSCFQDLDLDDHGSPVVVLAADGDCDDEGESVTDDDCDDADPTSFPGGPELIDGADNDCDGQADESLWSGTGRDGPLVIGGVFDLSQDSTPPRVVPDGISWVVTAIAGADITVVGPVVGLLPGDEVLVANLHGTDLEHAAAGTWESGSVAAIAGDVVTLALPVARSFGRISNADLSGQAIVLQRVPHYSDVTVQANGELTAGDWNGARGGIVAFRASGMLLVEEWGAVTADSLGYAGGATGTSYNRDSFQGESYAGQGDGNVLGSPYNQTAGYWGPNYGGGGATVTGAGGNHAGGAQGADSWNGGLAPSPLAGLPYGTPELTEMFFGSGGGGVWNGGWDQPGEFPGPGGDGAGIVLVGASAIQVEGALGVTAIGGTTMHWSWGSWTYGAGGGAGGTIWLLADTLSLAPWAVDATGGLGEQSHIRHGGSGGVGRVRIDCVACNGFPQGSPDAEAELDVASEPDPGWSALPE